MARPKRHTRLFLPTISLAILLLGTAGLSDECVLLGIEGIQRVRVPPETVAARRSDDRVLLCIDRIQRVRVPPEIVATLSPVLELRTVWVASAPSSVVQQLRRLGASLRVLEQPAESESLHLIRARLTDPARQLPRIARAWPLEEELWLVAGAAGLTRDQLPADASFEQLTGRVNVPVVLETSGARAVVRQQASTEAAADPRVQALVAWVSPDRLAADIQDLENFQTRYVTTGNARAAAETIFRRFAEAGVAVHTEEFVSGGVMVSNVIATIPGRVSPNQVVIVGAHYDSFARTSFLTTAPGADDNASGTAGVMELARILAGRAFDFTVRLVAFAAEETGLNGSRDYAARARQRGEQVVGMLDLDMIAFVDRAPEDVDVTANPASTWLVDQYVSLAAAYTGLPVRKIVDASSRSSDHAPFWDQGYSAVEIIEDIPLVNPYYHTTEDRFGTLNMSFATDVVCTTLAVAATLAQPVSAPAPPATVRMRSQISSSLFSNLETTLIEWDRSSDAAIGYNVYQAANSHGDYRKLNAAPITGTSFAQNRFFRSTTMPDRPFYVITAVDASGREGNRSMEVRAQ
jgi:hypothetical protein